MNPFVYEPRVVEYHGNLDIDDHRLKIYSIRSSKLADLPFPDDAQVVKLLKDGLPDPELDTDHKVGFGILHFADDGLYTLINTWYDANMLRMRAFLVDDFMDANPQFTSLAHLNVIACVWELEIYKYERDLWVRSVLEKRPDALDETVLEPYFTYGLRGLI